MAPSSATRATSGSVEFGQPDPTGAAQDDFSSVALGDVAIGDVEPTAGRPASAQTDIEGPFTEDGTLVKPIAVDTTVRDGSALVKTYTVKGKETLATIAARFSVSTMSVVWANNLKSKTAIHAGQVLRIPPVTGLIVTVTAADTLDSIAARYNVNGTDILATNGLDDATLVTGQVLVLPGAQGAALAAPPSTTTHVSSGGSGSSIRGPSTYKGGKFLWPVVGGGNYISQYFHYGHYAIDIAADYGSTVRAAAAGTVTFAGWKNNGGGYQVWISHGSNLYTTYNHMSAITVGAGQHVSRGDAGRSDRDDRRRDRTALPLRGLARPDLGRRDRGSTRWPTSRPIAPPRGRHRPSGRRSAGDRPPPCENGHDVPRPREDLGPRR